MAHDRDLVLPSGPAGALRLRVSEAGEGGRPLLLVHGFTGSRTDFEDHLDALAELGFHVVAPDQRGHGDSDQPDDEADYSFAAFVSDLLALADELGWDRFVLLGHSMGGMVVQRLVLRAPERVAALILMDTGGEALVIDPELRELGVRVAREHGTEAIADVVATMEGPLDNEAYRRHAAEDPTYAARGDRNLRASAAPMYAAMLTALTTHDPIYDRLAEVVTCPTLVIVGEHDTPFHQASDRLAAAIPGARLVTVAGGGHSPQFEAAELWWKALSGFLTGLS